MARHVRSPAIFLMGPTGAGKTALAVELAAYLPCEIISVDSAMIYRGMDIGTAKPDADVLARAPHRLIGIRDPVESYSAAEFRRDALAAMGEITAQGRIPLLVGGTGLYFRALERGLSQLPQANTAVRERLQAEQERAGLAALHRRLAKVDPESARRIHPNDSQRILRALEVFELTGRPLSEGFRDRRGPECPYRLIKLILAPAERGWLHARAAQRFHDMLKAGFIDEVKRLHARGDLHPALPSMRVVGYRQAWRYCAGEDDLAAMTEKAITATRQLAKRQLTWLRDETDAHWLAADQEAAALTAMAVKILRQELEPVQ
ncbi:MAG TPA: tRNA (adenosine(37)-N6)-dimethylallyltransferase MiaA [Gammaproteobacteria bacterium]|nr:tRNA (adenosine(37)-N6)-dimethylallyltransferase MiaA [Gammaproteobacteria bacterium]